MAVRKQVVLIHGGDSFRSRREFLRALKTWPVSIKTFLPGSDWKGSLPQVLGRGWQVLSPKMPNKMNARYQEWEIYLQRMLPFVKNNAVVIGHSLGAMFLVKYLSKHWWPKRLKALILIAAPDNRV